MNSDFLNLVIPIASLYIAVLSVVFMYAVLRRERRRASDNYAPEATRWLENAGGLKTLGWLDAAVITAYVSLELTIRGIAKQRMIAESEIPLIQVARKLADDTLLSDQDIKTIKGIADIRNYIVHGQKEHISKEESDFAYKESVRIVESLLMTKEELSKKRSIWPF